MGKRTLRFEDVVRIVAGRFPDRQSFVFGPEGAPFRAARPLAELDLTRLAHALAVLEDVERVRAKPFLVHAPGLLAGALALERLDVYIVVLTPPEHGLSAEAFAVRPARSRAYAGAVRDRRELLTLLH